MNLTIEIERVIRGSSPLPPPGVYAPHMVDLIQSGTRARTPSQMRGLKDMKDCYQNYTQISDQVTSPQTEQQTTSAVKRTPTAMAMRTAVRVFVIARGRTAPASGTGKGRRGRSITSGRASRSRSTSRSGGSGP